MTERPNKRHSALSQYPFLKAKTIEVMRRARKNADDALEKGTAVNLVRVDTTRRLHRKKDQP